MGMIAPQDAAMLIAESREHPTHVGVLQLFSPPLGAGEDFVSQEHQRLLKFDQMGALFRKRPQDPVSSVGQMWWTEDDDVDMEYHVRLTALPRPRKVRQLLEMTSNCTAACSTGTARSGSATSSRSSRTAGSRCTSRSTTRSSTG